MTTKSVWGPCVWYLFHTLSYHIKDTNAAEFEKTKTEFVKFAFRIATNLPCPECSQHATQFVGRVNPALIKTKEQLNGLFIDFHNAVNQRKGKPVFTRDEAYAKYKTANVRLVIEYFFQIYGKKTVNVKLMVNNFHKDILLSEFRAWVTQNTGMFY
jgi:hypothetical protein